MLTNLVIGMIITVVKKARIAAPGMLLFKNKHGRVSKAKSNRREH
jgi:hypothetical protein